jgi:anti-sigma B factor antagonist
VTSYELEVRETDLGNATLAELSGELDLTNADELERRLDELAADSSALVLDLNGVEFLDSAALHVLFGLARRSASEARGFGLVLGSEAPVARTLSMVNFGEVAPVRPTLEDVLAGLGTP